MISLRSGSNRSGGSRRLAGESATDLTQGPKTSTGVSNKLQAGQFEEGSGEYEMGRPV
jgi:hypothetical protein